MISSAPSFQLCAPDTVSIRPGHTPGSQPSKLRKGGACPISFQNPRHPMQKCCEEPCLLYPPASQPQRILSQHPFSMPLSQCPLPQHPFSTPPTSRPCLRAPVPAPPASMTGTRNQESGTAGQRLRSVFLAFPSVSISPKTLEEAMESMIQAVLCHRIRKVERPELCRIHTCPIHLFPILYLIKVQGHR